MRKSNLASEKVPSLVVFTRHRAMGSLPSSGDPGHSLSGLCQLKGSSPEGVVLGSSDRKVSRLVSPGASRFPAWASIGGSGKFNSTGIPQLTMGSTRTPVSSAAAKPGELSGGAG